MGPTSAQSNSHDFAIPSADSSGFGTSGLASTSSLAFNSASTIAGSSSSTLRKEGKVTLNRTLLRHAHRHAKPSAYELGKPNHTLKEKRSAYSSRYALSLMDLFTSSNTPSVGSSSGGGSSRAINRCPPSYTAQANAIISVHVPACTVASTLSTCKSVSIDQRVTTFGNDSCS